MRSPLLLTVVVWFATSVFTPSTFAEATKTGASTDSSNDALSLIVMDPLALPLSCPCVEGYAQRRYEKLTEHLSQTLGREVKLTFADALEVALKKTDGRADIIIGKDSVIRADAARAKRKFTATMRLTDTQGSTQQHGLIVVNRNDPAQKVEDLAGYNIVFGPSEAEEKHGAAKKLLTDAGVTLPVSLTIDAACSDGACKVIDLGPQSRSAAVISSYAQPLLEGCGTIKKGDLRVVGQTESVPFVTVFCSDQLDRSELDPIREAMMGIATNAELLDALESLMGFVAIEKEPVAAKKK